ncbi:hypothetical protein [Nocardia rhizosphaerae]|uniref:Uncharacterized protein n=1 Tax=Nocardia rhizosphaerae TaxID=1691571 RepID=A0ABV8L9T2_9NOCA
MASGNNTPRSLAGRLRTGQDIEHLVTELNTHLIDRTSDLVLAISEIDNPDTQCGTVPTGWETAMSRQVDEIRQLLAHISDLMSARITPDYSM